jgi:DNA-binding NarL/FixJ family response regulator
MNADVLLVAAEPLFRVALAALLTERFASVEACETADRARHELSNRRPAVALIVLDPPLDDAPLTDVCEALIGSQRTTPALVLLRQPRPWVVRMVSAYGARGIYDTAIEPDRLCTILSRIQQGYVDCDPRFVPHLMPPATVSGLSIPARPPLTDAQLDALRLLAEGYSTKEIARALNTSADAIDHAVERATKRLGASHRTQAVAIALREGMLT